MSVFKASVQFAFRGHLAPHLVQKDPAGVTHGLLRQIPGVVIAKDATRLWAPPSAVKPVWEILNAAGVHPTHYAVKNAHILPGAYSFEDVWPTVEKKIRESRIHSWLIDDSAPTADRPIRLMQYQREGVAWAVTMGSAAMWAPTGSGKTWMAAVWAACGVGPILEVTPSPQARRKHAQEVRRISTLQPYNWKPKSQILKKDQWKSIEEYVQWCREEGQQPYVISSWGGLVDRIEAIRDVLRPRSVIWDELHRGKQEKRSDWIPTEDGGVEERKRRSTSSAAHQLAEIIPRRLGTTASPIGHRLRDLWGQQTLIEPWGWGKTSSAFLMRYCGGRPGEFAGIEADGMTCVPELKHRLRFTVWAIDAARTHAELPEKRREVVWVPAAQQVKAFRWTKREEREAVLDKTETTVARHRVQQMRLGEAASRKRRAVVKDLVEWMRGNPTAKIVVFTGRRVDCEELGRQLDNKLAKKGVTVWASHGGHTQQSRIDIEREFMGDPETGLAPHPGPCILVGTQGAWGESLDLQDADLLCQVTLPWTPKMVIQTEGRVHRHGMRRKVLIRYYLAEDTYDERVAQILISKLPAVEAFTGNDMDGLGDQLMGLDQVDLDDLDNIYGMDF